MSSRVSLEVFGAFLKAFPSVESKLKWPQKVFWSGHSQLEELLERNGNSGNVGLSAASDILSISREILHSSSQFQSWESDPTQSIASGLNLLHTAAGCLVDEFYYFPLMIISWGYSSSKFQCLKQPSKDTR